MGFFKNVGSKLFGGMTGWKTKAGAVLVALGGIMQQMPDLFEGQKAVAQAMLTIGAALTGVGIAHKIEKAVGK